jgi:hypothetical protein
MFGFSATQVLSIGGRKSAVATLADAMAFKAGRDTSGTVTTVSDISPGSRVGS